MFSTLDIHHFLYLIIKLFVFSTIFFEIFSINFKSLIDK